MKITFKPCDIEYELKETLNLFQTAEKAGVQINGSCGGNGSCGKCKIQILQGSPGMITASEEALLSDLEKKQGYRLACCIIPHSDLTVFVPPVGRGVTGKKEIAVLPEDFKVEKTVIKTVLHVEKASLEQPKSDLDQVLDALQKTRENKREIPWTLPKDLIQKIPKVLQEEAGCVTLVTRNERIVDIEAGNTQNDCYGAAFDIGTTTVVGMLWDLEQGTLRAVSARANPQRVFGADVISRIQYSSVSSQNLREMQEKIIACFSEIFTEFEKQEGVRRSHIYEITVAGNTTMSHLFLGVSPDSLARAPFTPVFCSSVDTLAEALGLNCNPKANVHLLPNISGHVGSDMAAVLVASDLKEKKGCNLVIDIGTNGEILLAKDGKIVTCSTAAGPAFEGASISCGMRAAEGAIEKVMMQEGHLELSVIGEQEPVGICGSGLIDAIAQMLDCGILNEEGRILEQTAAESKGIRKELTDRLYDGEQGRGFILHRKEGEGEILLTQKDIREVQLAKGAIFAGIKIVMGELGVKAEELDCVLLAGAFGNYIKRESALRIGLFPKIALEKVIGIGNAAGTGVSMALLSDTKRAYADHLAKEALHIELASHPDFQAEFFKAMYFER